MLIAIGLLSFIGGAGAGMAILAFIQNSRVESTTLHVPSVSAAERLPTVCLGFRRTSAMRVLEQLDVENDDTLRFHRCTGSDRLAS